MRITYYEETDSAVIVLREPGSDTVGEIAGEDLIDPKTAGVVLHRDDAGELYEIEIYSKASKRLDLDRVEFCRVPAGSTARGTKVEAKMSAPPPFTGEVLGDAPDKVDRPSKGKYANVPTNSEAFAARKQEEIELEERSR